MSEEAFGKLGPRMKIIREYRRIPLKVAALRLGIDTDKLEDLEEARNLEAFNSETFNDMLMIRRASAVYMMPAAWLIGYGSDNLEEHDDDWWHQNVRAGTDHEYTGRETLAELEDIAWKTYQKQEENLDNAISGGRYLAIARATGQIHRGYADMIRGEPGSPQREKWDDTRMPHRRSKWDDLED